MSSEHDKGSWATDPQIFWEKMWAASMYGGLTSAVISAGTHHQLMAGLFAGAGMLGMESSHIGKRFYMSMLRNADELRTLGVRYKESETVFPRHINLPKHFTEFLTNYNRMPNEYEEYERKEALFIDLHKLGEEKSWQPRKQRKLVHWERFYQPIAEVHHRPLLQEGLTVESLRCILDSPSYVTIQTGPSLTVLSIRNPFKPKPHNVIKWIADFNGAAPLSFIEGAEILGRDSTLYCSTKLDEGFARISRSSKS